nr:hypothetical protein [uncultured Rhodopila sp.]
MFTAEDVNEQLSQIVRRAATPSDPGERINQMIQRAARRLRLPASLTKRLWYQEQRSVPAHVALNLMEFDRQSAELRERLRLLQAELDALRGG